MKLLLFAHTPPPHHGQSYMVKLMLEGLGGDQRRPGAASDPPIACYHVNARFSDGMDDIGTMRGGKGLRLLRYCAEAIWCRFRYGATTFYHVPAPGKRLALYRDWVMLILCRPFFRHWVMHWHAVGLGEWLEKEGTRWERAVTRWLFSGISLGISLTETNRPEVASFRPRQIAIVPNGIPDLCPDFDARLLPRRQARARERVAWLGQTSGKGPLPYQLLYLGHCTREKGVFDLLDAVALVNATPGGPIRAHLTIAGSFLSRAEEEELRERTARADLRDAVTWIGFAGPAEKARLLEACDCLCFPGYYLAESFGLVVVEAMAFGVTVLATRWRATPELFPQGYPGLVPIRSPEAIAASLPQLAALDLSVPLRRHFVEHFTLGVHLAALQAALLSVEKPPR